MGTLYIGRTRTVLQVLALLGHLLAGSASAEERIALGSDRLSIGFKVEYLAILGIDGRFLDASGELYYDAAAPQRSSLMIVARTASVSTGSSLRDRTLRSESFFDAARHPRLSFQSTRIAMATPDSGRVTGRLTLLGVTREVALDFTLRRRSGPHLSGGLGTPSELRAVGVIHRSEWGMTSLLPAVSDEVVLDVRIALMADR